MRDGEAHGTARGVQFTAQGLDFEGDRTFMQAVETFRGQSTIFMVTHRPSHLRIADRILVFDAGYLRLAGPAEEVRARIPPDLI